MMSTGGNSAPFSFVMSPTWVMLGKRSFVTAMGKASISEAHTAVEGSRQCHQISCPSSVCSFCHRLYDRARGVDGGLRGIDSTHEVCLGGGIQSKGSGDTGDLAGGEHEAKP